jgi:3-dehydroquinate synthase
VIWRRELSGTGRPSLIVVGTGALAELAIRAHERAQAGARLFVVTDSNVGAAWGERVASFLDPALRSGDILPLAPGEGSKSAASLGACWDWLVDRGCRRGDTVVALGGGVIGDLAGFAAATYLRGVGLWQIPTSLLAQVDSSVGGKTAINLEAGKNLAGAFYQPDLVMVDPVVLATLPENEYRGGLGEVVKYGLLDAGLFAYLEQERRAVLDRRADTLAELVQGCIAYKAAVVEEDELDRGRRAVLNLGHTVGHAIEATTGYRTVSHGQAVALGILAALTVSEHLLDLDRSVRLRTTALLRDLGLAVQMTLPSVEALLAVAARDKKASATSLNFVGLRAPGEPVWGLEVPEDVLRAGMEVIRA